MRSFSLPLSDCGLTHRCFLKIFGVLLYGDLVLCLSFRAGVYGTKTGVFSRKIKFVIFACSFASIAAALRRRKNGLVFAPKKLCIHYRVVYMLKPYSRICFSDKKYVLICTVQFTNMFFFYWFSIIRQIPLIF